MNQEQEMNGFDTILGLVGELPKVIGVPYSTQYTQEILRQSWNSLFIAIIPYCFKCKEPLVWHLHPKRILFHCPKCKTKWVKAKGWDKAATEKKLGDPVGKDG